MSFRKALLMLAVIIVGTFLFLKDQSTKPTLTPELLSETESKVRFFPTFKSESIEKISVVSPKGLYALVHPTIEGEVDTSRWTLAQPQNAPVDPERLKKIIFALENLESKNVIKPEEQEEGETYGLEPPEMVVIFKGGNLPPALSVGKEHPFTRRRYAQLEGDPRLFLIDAPFFDLLNASREEMRDRHPLRQDLTNLRQVLLTRPGADIVTFDKTESGKWMAKLRNEAFEVETNLLIGRLNRFLNVKVDQFLDQDENSLSALVGLKAPVLTMTLFFSSADTLDSRITIEVGEGVGPDGIGNYFRYQGSPFLYRTDVAFHLYFLRSIDGFRDRMPYRMLDFDRVRVVRARLRSGATIEIRSNEAGFVGPPAASIRNFMKNLELISFEGAVPQVIKDAGLLNPEAELEVEFASTGPEPAKKSRLLVGKEIDINEAQVAQTPGGSTDGPSVAETKPRWVGIQTGDNVLRPAIIGAQPAGALNKLFDEIRNEKIEGKGKE